MTGNEFRRIALSFPGAEEKEHMDHPDFRVGNKIFATLNYPDKTRGMVKLFPDQQQQMTQADPAMFEPVPGGWGKGGATRVHLKAAKAMKLREAMRLAWEKAAPKSKESKTKVKTTKRGKSKPKK